MLLGLTARRPSEACRPGRPADAAGWRKPNLENMLLWNSSSRADSNRFRTGPKVRRAPVRAASGKRARGQWSGAKLPGCTTARQYAGDQACRPPLSTYRQTTLQPKFNEKAKIYASRPADSERLRSRSLPAVECGRMRVRVRCWVHIQMQIRKGTAEALGVQDPERDGRSRRVRTEAWRDRKYRGPGQSCASLKHCAHYDVTPLIVQQFPSAAWAPRPPPHQPRFPAPAHIPYARTRR